METVFIGRNLIFLPETQSTNSYANSLLKKVKPPEGTVVYTNYQHSGKGQRGSSWKSEPAANITCSVILYPDFLKLQNQSYLYRIAALACYDTITELINSSQFDIKIKWPNDILLNKKKVSGILIENSIQDNRISNSVIGIGLNVNQEVFEQALNATSLSVSAGIKFDLMLVMKLLLMHFEKYYLALKSGQSEWIQTKYLKHLFGLNQWLLFEIDNKEISLKVTGISETGLLLLEDQNGLIFEADVKQLRWLY